MKLLRVTIIALIATLLISCYLTSQTNEPKLVLKAVLKGTYAFLDSDGPQFFLVDVKLINNTDSTCSFVVYSCETSLSLLVDYKTVTIYNNECGGNFPRLIEVKKKQTFSVPVILKVDRYNDIIRRPIKIGLVLLRCYNFSEVTKLILQKKERKENVIWSNPFFLDNHGLPYEVY